MTRQRLPRDSVLVSIPLDITADLGQVLRRVRTKRIMKLQSQYPTLFSKRQKLLLLGGDGAAKALENKDKAAAEESVDDDNKNNDNEKEHDEKGEKKKNADNEDDDENDDDSMTNHNTNATNTTGIQRDQYGSMLDYLEAKYAKGVMIDDLDERVREKKKQQQQKKKENITDGDDGDGELTTKDKKKKSDKDNEEGDDLSILSASAAGSCYSDDSGNFIDDSELNMEVALQLRASSAFGTTKIEAEALAKKKDENSKNNDDNEDQGGEEEKDGNGDNGIIMGLCDEGDDHAFFVNVGDLEMEDGYLEEDFDEEEGWMMAAKEKGKKRKRATKENTSSTKDAPKTKKTKANNTNTSTTATTDKTSTTSGGDKSKKIKANSPSKKSKTLADDIEARSAEKVKKANSTTKAKKESTDTKKEKESTTTATIVKSTSGEDTKKKNENKKDTKDGKKTTVDKTKLDAAKKAATDLKRTYKRLYKKCITEIKKMTEKELPRKPKSGGKVKVSITVPSNKKGGDMITFSNPHVPSQKLKVQIPENSKPGESFKVSVPMPKVAKATKNTQNKFTKSAIDALDEYSKAYDDWCGAEAEVRTIQPKKKAGKIEVFKPGNERLKKYDDMLKEFPKNLLSPIDAVWLRKLIRRNRQNANKRIRALALLETGDETTATGQQEAKTPTKKKSPKMMSLNVPGKGVDFPSVAFDTADFERKD